MLVFLLAVFALPVVIGLVLYHTEWRPGGESYGELLQPPRRLDIPTLQTLQGQPFDMQDWHAKWHLVYVSAAGCDTGCRNNLYMMRQIHASLAKEIERLERVWIVDGALSSEEGNPLQAQYPDLVILPAAGKMASQFNLPGRPATPDGRIYLVDPLGNLMMSYPSGADPKGMRKDLTRLLKYSWTG